MGEARGHLGDELSDANETEGFDVVWRKRHDEACRAQELAYEDPATGYRVFTAYGLSKRQQCCGSGCRHCPFGHRRVSPNRRRGLLTEPYVLGRLATEEPLTLMFWSGGKDSYLALVEMQLAEKRNILLVTLFDAETQRVTHQDLNLEVIEAQRVVLELPVLYVPTYSGDRYQDVVHRACAVAERFGPIVSLVFGDLNLASVRRWREEVFARYEREPPLELLFPLWNMPYLQLLDRLAACHVRCLISAVSSPELLQKVKVGDPFDRDVFQSLPGNIDGFGEGGEFHTVIEPTSLKPLNKLASER